MQTSPTLEFFGGGVLVFLGIVFLVGFGLDPQDLITDAIFIGFGVLLIRGGYQKSKKGPLTDESKTRGQKTTQDQHRRKKNGKNPQ